MLSSLPRVLPLSLAVVLVLGGCAKHEPSAEAAPAAVEPADTAPVADAAASADEPSAEQRAAAEKKAKIERALANQAIIDDPQGQWATQATASSTYASVITSAHNGEWTPEAATGAPDAANNGDDHAGWSPAKQDAGIEWLQLDYAQPVNAHALRVRQLGTPGAIIKVELIDDAGARHTVWDGSDDTAYDRDEISWFERRFEPTSYKAKGVRLTLATNAIDGRTYLDAVQLVGK